MKDKKFVFSVLPESHDYSDDHEWHRMHIIENLLIWTQFLISLEESKFKFGKSNDFLIVKIDK